MLRIFLLLVCWLGFYPAIKADDHADSPAVIDTPSLDITSFYAFKNKVSDQKMTFILNVNAHKSGEVPQAQLFDDTGRYAVFIDSSGDTAPDIEINIFLSDANSKYVFFVGKTPISGNFGEVKSANGIKAFVGYKDDPAYGDFEGLTNLLDSYCSKDGGYSGNGIRCKNTGEAEDFYRVFNVGVLAIEVPINLLTEASTGKIRVWAKSFKREREGDK